MKKLRCRLLSPWNKHIETDAALFSVDIAASTADAILSEWSPSNELLSFRKRKAWYCCEPQCCFTMLENGSWPGFKRQLAEHEFLFHGHKNPDLRVPHITHYEPLEMVTDPKKRKPKAIAIVSNQGGGPWKRDPETTIRNDIITAQNVDLYGRRSWRRFRSRWYSVPAAPRNYCGELGGEWHAHEKRSLQASYQVSVCMENMREEGYFTEKFVEAVMAGCVPVYAAHPSVVPAFLDGAVWVDPAKYCYSPQGVVAAALAADLSRVQSENRRWLSGNKMLSLTHSKSVFNRIGGILAVM